MLQKNNRELFKHSRSTGVLCGHHKSLWVDNGENKQGGGSRMGTKFQFGSEAELKVSHTVVTRSL